MVADLEEKVGRYLELFEAALESTGLARGLEPGPHAKGEEFLNMARAYFADGLQFKEDNDLVNALVCFSYGHAWLDAGLRMGILEGGVPS